METIKTFEELKVLPINTKVYCIKDGDVDYFIIIGLLKSSSGVAIAKGDKASFIYAHTFGCGIYTLEYDSNEIGLLMIEQIKEYSKNEIEAITEIYLNKK